MIGYNIYIVYILNLYYTNMKKSVIYIDTVGKQANLLMRINIPSRHQLHFYMKVMELHKTLAKKFQSEKK